MKTINSRLPIFPGFYNTNFEFDNEEMEVDSYNDENGTNYNFDDFIFDYGDYRKRVAEECMLSIKSELNNLFDIDMENTELVSPRFYNYSNDLIFVDYKIDHKNFKKIISYLKENEDSFIEYINEHFTSCDGFISFYDTDVFKWYNKYLKWEKLDENIFGVVLDFILKNEDYDEDELLHDTEQERSWISTTIENFEQALSQKYLMSKQEKTYWMSLKKKTIKKLENYENF